MTLVTILKALSQIFNQKNSFDNIYLFFAYKRFAINTIPTGIIVQNVTYVNNKLIANSRKNADDAKNWI